MREGKVGTNDQRWYQQPVAWLGVLILVATMAACIHLILFAAAHEDPPLPGAGEEANFRIPATRTPAATPAPTPPARP